MENVLAVKTELISKLLPKSGVETENCDDILAIIMSDHETLPRGAAETDPGYKQIIPYMTVCRGDEVFVMRRLKRGGEERLHGLLSLGVGGHINPEDGDEGGVLERGARRELEEEVSIETCGELRPRGMINDDTTEVGSVHLGLFYTLETAGEVAVRETEKLEGFWVKRSELPGMADRFESWSRLVIPLLQL